MNHKKKCYDPTFIRLKMIDKQPQPKSYFIFLIFLSGLEVFVKNMNSSEMVAYFLDNIHANKS